MTDDRPMDPAPEDEAPHQSGGSTDPDQSAEDFKLEIEQDPSANPPEELDRLRGG
jgi:hypothetical protein